MRIKEIVKQYGQPYSKMLGINLKSKKNSEIVKWFLASILYAKPIQESCATRTYKCFEHYGIVTARKIVDAGWDELVRILDEGSYVRYDFSTSDKLLEVFGNLQKFYNGNLNKFYASARDSQDLENKIKSLGKGIGDITVSIFLRDMRVIWPKAQPQLTPIVKKAMKALKIKDIKLYARKNKLNLIELETALLRWWKAKRKR